MTHYFEIPAIHSNLIQIFHFLGGQRAINEYFISYTHMLGWGLGVIWVRMIQCKTGKHADSFLSHCISVIIYLTLAQLCKMVQVSKADRMHDNGEQWESRLMASTQ